MQPMQAEPLYWFVIYRGTFEQPHSVVLFNPCTARHVDCLLHLVRCCDESRFRWSEYGATNSQTELAMWERQLGMTGRYPWSASLDPGEPNR